MGSVRASGELSCQRTSLQVQRPEAGTCVRNLREAGVGTGKGARGTVAGDHMEMRAMG